MDPTTCPRCSRSLPAGVRECACAARTAEPSPAGSRVQPSVPHAAGPRISRANRKSCEQCGADVTFAPRFPTADRTWRCAPCRDQRDGTIELVEAPPATAGEPVRSLTASPPFPATAARGLAAAPARVTSNVGRWIAASLAGVSLIGALAYVIFRPTWEDRHRRQIAAMLDDAIAARNSNANREAHEKFQAIVDLTAGKTIRSPIVADDIAQAHRSRDALRPLVQAELDREQRERDAAARRAEAERAARDKAALAADRRRTAERRARQEQAERQAEAARAAQQDALRVAAVRASPAFAELIDSARRVHSAARTSAATDDSAYRAIGIVGKGNLSLILLLARQEAMIREVDVSGALAAAENEHDLAMANETSAVRAIYKHDRATLAALGCLAAAWTEEVDAAARLSAEHRRLTEAAEARTRFDDSAPRAIAFYGDATMRMWAALADARAAEVAGIAAAADVRNAGDDSAWRVAERNAEAEARIVLSLVKARKPGRAIALEAALQRADLGETSALRSLAAKKAALSDALLSLIER